MNNQKAVREPLFHIVKNSAIPLWKAILYRAGSIVAGFLLCALMCLILFGANPMTVFAEMFNGAFGSPRRVRELLLEMALLLGIGFALVPSFKMKFWNLGGNGQILMGGLAAAACMFYLGGKLPEALVLVFATISAVVMGAVWAVIPAIFKSKWKTNESLFTLMMNYIASGLVSLFISIWVTEGSGVLKPSHLHNITFPVIFNEQFFTILIVAIISVIMTVYLRKSKHGYELSVVGESENTARYIGMNVKKVIIRTLVLSGAICGIMGLLLTASINGTISATSDKNMGFTAIMVVWLAHFNPFAMFGTSFLVAFLSKGMSSVELAFGITSSSVSNIVIALVYFVILGCEFFVSYKIKFNVHKNKNKSTVKENK